MFIGAYFLISLIGLIIATFTDFKERIIPNKLTYSLVAMGVGLHAVQAFVENDMMILGFSVFSLGFAFVLSFLLYKMGVWAGGDVKLMAALGALNPFNFGVLRDALGLNLELFSSLALPVFPLSLIIASVFSMLPYGVLITAGGIAKNPGVGREFISRMGGKAVQFAVISALVAGAGAVIGHLGLTPWLVLPVLLAAVFLPKLAKWALAAIVFVFAFTVDLNLAIQNFLVVFLPLLVLYSLIKLYSLGKEKVLKKKIRITELEEGMISGETFVKREEKIGRAEQFTIGNIIKYVANNNAKALPGLIQPKGMVVSSLAARGVTDEEIELLKGAVKRGEIKDEISIKLSAPFVPAMLIGYLALQLTGDLIWNLVL